MKHLPKLVLVGVVFVLLCFAFGACSGPGTAMRAAEEPVKATAIGWVLGLLALAVTGQVWGLLVASGGSALVSTFQRKAELANIAAKQESLPDAVPWFLDPWVLVRFAIGWAIVFLVARWLWLRYGDSLLGKASGLVHDVTSLGVAPLARKVTARRKAHEDARRRLQPTPPLRPPTVQTGQEQGPHAQ